MQTDKIIGFIGGGNMARSLIGGLLTQVPAHAIIVAEPQENLRHALKTDFNVIVTDDNAYLAKQADIIILAVKPQVMSLVCGQIKTDISTRQPLIISIAAGVRLEQLSQWLGIHLPIVRAMPNTPALLGLGVTALTHNAHVHQSNKTIADDILQAVGKVVWIAQEQEMDVVTAISGSGPAYFFLMMEAMEAAAIQQGLPAEIAQILVRETAFGAASMARNSTYSPAQLREQVTSPGGTTQAALTEFEKAGYSDIIATAIASATQRGQELAKQYTVSTKESPACNT